MGRFARFVAAVGLVVLAMLGTRPAAAAIRPHGADGRPADLACYVGALAEVFDDARNCS